MADVMSSMVLNGMRDASHEASKAWFPQTADSLDHHVLAMCGEAGEVANVVKKLQRGSFDEATARELLKGELADVFIYLLNCAAILEIDLAEEYFKKQQFNLGRF